MGNALTELSELLSFEDSEVQQRLRQLGPLPRNTVLRILHFSDVKDLVMWQCVSHEWEELCITATTKLPDTWCSAPNKGCKDIVGIFYNLAYLRLEDNQFITDETLKGLLNLKSVAIVGETKVRQGLASLPRLKSLELVNTNISGEILEVLSPSITSLHLTEVPPFPEDLLHRFTGLTYLHLERTCDISDDTISKFTNLKRLHLIEQDLISDESIYILTQLVDLEYRNIYGDTSLITDGGLSYLTNLTSLNLQQNYSQNITDYSISKFTNLKRLYIEPYRNPMITDKGLSVLKHLKYLNNQAILENDIPCLRILKSEQLRSPPTSPNKPRQRQGDDGNSKLQKPKAKKRLTEDTTTDDWSDVTYSGAVDANKHDSSSDCAQQ